MEYKKSKNNKNIYICIAIFIVLIVLFRNNVDYIRSIVNSNIQTVKGFLYRYTLNVKGSINNIVYLKNTIEENRRLSEENYTLKIKTLKLKEIEQENMRLHDILRMKQENKYDFVVSKVILRDSLSLYESLIINMGKRDGIKKNMVVLNREMLLGKVSEVYETTSKVDLITKKGFYVSVVTEDGNNLGILRGENHPKMTLEYITIDNVVKEGYKIVTSGISEIYPKGIQVGVIEKIEKTNNNLFDSITVKLPYNVLYINEVLILTGGKK